MFDFGVLKTKKNISIQELSDQYWSGIACCEHDSTKESTEKNNTLDKENPETRCAYWQLLDATTRQMSKVRRRAVPNFKWPDICLDAHTHTHTTKSLEKAYTRADTLKGRRVAQKKNYKRRINFAIPKRFRVNCQPLFPTGWRPDNDVSLREPLRCTEPIVCKQSVAKLWQLI